MTFEYTKTFLLTFVNDAFAGLGTLLLKRMLG